MSSNVLLRLEIFIQMHVGNIKYNVNVTTMLSHITQKYPILYPYTPFLCNVKQCIITPYISNNICKFTKGKANI